MKSAVEKQNILALSDMLGQQPEEDRRISWPMVQFGRLYAEPSRNGIYKPRNHHGTGVKIVNMGELFAHDIINGQEMKRVHMTDAEMSTSGLRDGDLLFGRRSLVESGAGKCSLVEGLTEPTTFESSIIRVRVNESMIRARFIFYWLKSRHGRGRVQAIVTGTNVKGIRGSILKTIDVPCPPLSAQDKIVSILSAYDDLIENNRRRIQLLEQAGRLLYEEWFVRFRYPGHERMDVRDGVPEGWRRVRLSEVVDTQYGFTQSATDEPIGPKFLRGKDINKASYIDWGTVPYCSEQNLDFDKYALNVDDLLVVRMADPGKVAIVETEQEAVFASYLVRLSIRNGANISPLYLFFVLSDDAYQGFVSRASGGSTRKSARAKLLVDFRVLVPSSRVMAGFVALVRPLRRQIQKLLRQNASLKRVGDLLLPRLMNGEVTV